MQREVGTDGLIDNKIFEARSRARIVVKLDAFVDTLGLRQCYALPLSFPDQVSLECRESGQHRKHLACSWDRSCHH